MLEIYADLHIHIGRNSAGRQVKITASADLTLENILTECVERKGIELIGIIDCACTGVLKDLRGLIAKGDLKELPEGGLLHRKKVVLIPGAEIEAVEPGGGVSHHLCYFPYLRNLAEFSRAVGRHITNMELSSLRRVGTAVHAGHGRPSGGDLPRSGHGRGDRPPARVPLPGPAVLSGRVWPQDGGPSAQPDRE